MFLAGVKPVGLTVSEYLGEQENVDMNENYIMFTFNSTYKNLPDTRFNRECVVISDPNLMRKGQKLIFSRTDDCYEANQIRKSISEYEEAHKDYECFIVHFMLLAKLFKEIPYDTPLMGDLND